MSLNISLIKFLNNKTLYYDKIDYNTISKSWNILKNHITLPYVIHIIGTNGKGTTGRYLATLLNNQNKQVLHYSSPHIIKFNERIWINGKNSSNKQLNNAHKIILNILPSTLISSLTYFEYTTLLSLLLSDNLDFLILEAGLGGEFDATNVVKNNLTLITTIDFDHQEFLGNTIEKIAKTKMRSCDTSFIIGSQIHQSEIQNVKNKILKDKKEINFNNNVTLPIKSKQLPKYLQNNLKLAINALIYLNLQPTIYSNITTLPGRYEKLTSNIIIDVGHNPLAANIICQQLQKENKKIILIYNSYENKDYKQVLNILKPIIKEIQIIQCDDKRIAKYETLKIIINNLSLNVKNFDIMNLNANENYLVFGSFLVVEAFLKLYKRLDVK